SSGRSRYGRSLLHLPRPGRPQCPFLFIGRISAFRPVRARLAFWQSIYRENYRCGEGEKSRTKRTPTTLPGGAERPRGKQGLRRGPLLPRLLELGPVRRRDGRDEEPDHDEQDRVDDQGEEARRGG